MAMVLCPHCGKQTSNERGVCLLCDKMLFAKPQTSKPPESIAVSTSAKPRQISLNLSIAGFIVCFVVGILSGREWLRYEFRRDVEKVFSGASAALNDPVQRRTSKPMPQLPEISVAIVSKEYVSSEYRKGLKLVLMASNKSGKDVIGMRGRLELLDGYETKISSYLIDEEMAIRNGDSVTFTNYFTVNQFNASDNKAIEVEKFSSRFTPTGALFSDGTKFIE